MKVLSIIGTRPEVIKMASIIQQLDKIPNITSIVCVTAQHRQMLDQMLDIFRIHPDIDLDLMTENQTLAAFTAKATIALSDVIQRSKPDIVLVQGDTTTAMVGSLVAFYEKVKVGHVEAGMRTHDRYNPFPEEINRRLISELATYHFAPTHSAVASLKSEGIDHKNIYLTGSTAIDALLSIVKSKQKRELTFSSKSRRLILVTAHRRENLGSNLTNICLALYDLIQRNKDIEILFPVHLNPGVQTTVKNILSGIDRISLVNPLDYCQFAYAMEEAYLILTDSGGVQTEAPALNKPILVLRNETEWPEGITAGVAKLIGTDCENIIRETETLLNDHSEYKKMISSANPYGDGNSAKYIVQAILEGESS